MDLKESEILGDNVSSHWYYQAKAKAMFKLLDKIGYTSILDVGAGSGFFTKYLLHNSTASSAYCVDISYPFDFDGKEGNKIIKYRRSIESSDANLVLMMDVLEHVEDDVSLLSEYAKKVPSGTKFLISVPAFNFLWSDHDLFLEHYRRYSLEQLTVVISCANLKICKSGYFFVYILPIVIFFRFFYKKLFKINPKLKSDLKKHHPITNRLLSLICSIENKMIGVNRIAGLTVFCIAEKK